MFFTNKGRVYAKKAYRIPEAGRTAKGTNLVNIIELTDGEYVTAIIPITEFTDGEYLTMVTRYGIIKRTLLKEFEYQRRSGKIAITLDEGDELIFVRHTHGGEGLILATREGLAVRFDEENVRCMGRNARGVKGITLADDDYVVGVCVVDPERTLLTITDNGIGKRTPFDDFREMKHRGGHGVCCQKITEKTGKLAAIISVLEDDDVMLITNEGIIIRTSVSSINVHSRTATGVIIMRLAEGATINNIARIEKAEEIEKASEAVEEEIKHLPPVSEGEIESDEEVVEESTEVAEENGNNEE
jgi:DNA gyrase subunit A